jgi:NAD(P)-dependent dehydrogenase (short-subunit alcohol dehydrogenase family)
VARTVKQFGRLDVLVNNAAFQVHTSRFEDLTAEHFDETLKTNLYGSGLRSWPHRTVRATSPAKFCRSSAATPAASRTLVYKAPR